MAFQKGINMKKIIIIVIDLFLIIIGIMSILMEINNVGGSIYRIVQVLLFILLIMNIVIQFYIRNKL